MGLQIGQRGNEESLKQYYKAKRQSPILGNEAYVERIRGEKGTQTFSCTQMMALI
jgi:hypothetical protein